MSKRIEEWSVGALARLAGVTVRTLHHYDAIGLLPPAHVAANGYRLYRRPELMRLQEILFYRAAGMPLGEIAALLDGGCRLERLRAHRRRLQAAQARQAALIATLDATIAHLEGDRDMTSEDLYRPFTAARQSAYEAWLVETYGGDMPERIASARAARAAVPGGMTAAMARLADAERALVALYEAGAAPEDDTVAPALAQHRAVVAEMWGRPCPPEAHAGLADVYLGHPDFVARYEALSPGFSAWLPAAMKAQAAG